MPKYWYARVSTTHQSLARQIRMAEEQGIDPGNVYAETASGAHGTRRDALERLMDAVGDGDEVHVESFSRLSRSLSDLLAICDQLTGMGVKIVSQKEGVVDTATATGRLTLHMIGAIAEFEREIQAERRLEGQTAKRLRDGRCGGRPPVDEDKLEAAFELYRRGDRSIRDICKIVGIKRSTFYKHKQLRGVTRD